MGDEQGVEWAHANAHGRLPEEVRQDLAKRERVVYEEDGQTKTTRFMYPLKKIGRIIASGQLRQVDNDKIIVF